MDGVISWGVSLIVWLQSMGSWLTKPIGLFSFLGSEQFYLLVAPAVLWCWNAGLGLRLGLYLMVSSSINTMFKMIFHGPRPFWVDSQVHVGAEETSFGVPSGHAQNAVIVWGTLADSIGKKVAWIVAIIIIFLIGLSRLVLAVHFPHDVLVGWAIGAILLWILLRITPSITVWLKKQRTYVQILAALAGSLSLILLGFLIMWSTSNFSISTEWINNATVAFKESGYDVEEPITPFALSGLVSNAGIFFGFATGAILMEKIGGFSNRGKWWQLILRYLVGLIGVAIFYIGLGEVFPSGNEFVPYILRYIRYALVGIWVTGLAPYLFRKLHLASAR